MGKAAIYGLKQGRKVKVRCLGPGPEHNFWSVNKTTNRICPICAKRLDRVPPEYREPIHAQ